MGLQRATKVVKGHRAGDDIEGPRDLPPAKPMADSLGLVSIHGPDGSPGGQIL